MLDDAGSLSFGFRKRREGKETGEEERKQNEESDEWMISNFWRKKKKHVQFSVLFSWSFSFCGVLHGGGGGGSLEGPSWWDQGEVKGYRCVCVRVCQPAISCCPVTAPALGAWRPSGASCCPGTPAGRQPALTPGSHRPPSPSDLRTHPQQHKHR